MDLVLAHGLLKPPVPFVLRQEVLDSGMDAGARFLRIVWEGGAARVVSGYNDLVGKRGGSKMGRLRGDVGHRWNVWGRANRN